MKKPIIFLCTLSLLLMISAGCATKELSPEEKALLQKINLQLPFQVAIDGNTARTDSVIAAVIEEPVTATSEIVCTIENNDIINISFMPSDKEGIVIPGKKPALILLRDGNKTTLNQTTDKKKLKPGYYLMDVTSGDKTSRIVIEVK